VEEMRRVICYLDWKRDWWTKQAKQRYTVDAELNAGLASYAAKQASINQQLANNFAEQWFPFLLANSLPVDDWPMHYKLLPKKVKCTPEKISVNEEDVDSLELDEDGF
jgi:hypothetical protein